MQSSADIQNLPFGTTENDQTLSSLGLTAGLSIPKMIKNHYVEDEQSQNNLIWFAKVYKYSCVFRYEYEESKTDQIKKKSFWNIWKRSKWSENDGNHFHVQPFNSIKRNFGDFCLVHYMEMHIKTYIPYAHISFFHLKKIVLILKLLTILIFMSCASIFSPNTCLFLCLHAWPYTKTAINWRIEI